MPHILIFKTNIESKKDLKKVKSHLNEHKTILNWNVDTEDVDKVLRVESSIPNIPEIIDTIKVAGYHCEELTD